MLKTTSKDGTQIAYEKSGKGQSLVIIGGSLADHSFYAPLGEQLASDYTVYNIDRRGRGESTDTQPYSVEREVEDIAAVVDKAGEQVILYGHSAGSALALNAAAAKLPIAKLILVDPPFTAHSDNDTEAIVQFNEEYTKVKELHSKGDHRGNAAQFLRGFGMSKEEVDDTLDSPAGTGMIACAEALPYDYAVLDDGLVPINKAKDIDVPTFILAAGYSLDAAQQLADAIFGSKLKTLPSSTHEMVPDELANVIKELN